MWRGASSDLKREAKFKALQTQCSILYRFFFPNYLDSGFYSIVDDLLEAVGMRLGFYFIGVEGEVSVGNNIVIAV